MYKVVFIDSADERYALVKSIRTSVFTNEQGAIAHEEFDCFDNQTKSSYFALVYDGDCAIATGRIAVSADQYKIGRIAVLKSYRGKGVGAVLVRALIEKSIALGADKIFVDSQLHAVAFYEKFGFKVCSDEQIIDRGIAHLPMMSEVRD